MNLTNHASIRMQQRGFQDGMIDILLLFGESKSCPGGCTNYYMSNKRIKNLIQLTDKLKSKAVIVDEASNTIITGYNINR